MADLILADAIDRDMSGIWEAVARNNGDEVADRIVDRLIEALQQIAAFPGLGRHTREYGDGGHRVLNHSRWRIVYHYVDDVVTILRIVDGSRELGSLDRP